MAAKPNGRFTPFCVDEPGDFFHAFAGNPLVGKVGALAHLERDHSRRAQKHAQHRLFALGESMLNVRPVARAAKRDATLGFGTDPYGGHTLAF